MSSYGLREQCSIKGRSMISISPVADQSCNITYIAQSRGAEPRNLFYPVSCIDMMEVYRVCWERNIVIKETANA